jgi:hypothetical protein
METGTRAVHIPGVAAHPAGARPARLARNLLMDPGDRVGQSRFLARDRDGKVTATSGEILAGNGTRVIKTPARSPRASALAERLAGTLRRECPDHVPVPGDRHLRKVPPEYAGTITATVQRKRRLIGGAALAADSVPHGTGARTGAAAGSPVPPCGPVACSPRPGVRVRAVGQPGGCQLMP